MTDLLRIHELYKSYDGQPAVTGASFSLQQGEFLALLGPSGCGKTTTLRLIAGLERPDSGEIHIQDRLVSSRQRFVAPHKRRVGLVFQDYALFPHMTVANNIAYGLGAAKRNRVEELLALVGLDELGDRLPYQLSGGQQQRVALARALAPRPDILLLDEPFSNLDTSLRQRVREEVKTIIAATGVSAILVTHDQPEAMSMADQIAVMLDGTIKQIGTPREVYQYPSSAAVMRLLGEVNELAGEARGDSVLTALGELPLQSPITGAVRVYVRPENLKLETASDGNGTVEAVRYLGPHQTIRARLDSGETVEVTASPFHLFSAGDSVTISATRPVIAS